MTYKKFVKLAVAQDKRNKFVKCNSKTMIPAFNKEYDEFNPKDVEVVLKDLTSVKFYAVESFAELKLEYLLPDDCTVFATQEGDPIWERDGKVYTYQHGSGKNAHELIANSFNDYLKKIIKSMKQ